jgi:hypothetical protein
MHTACIESPHPSRTAAAPSCIHEGSIEWLELVQNVSTGIPTTVLQFSPMLLMQDISPIDMVSYDIRPQLARDLDYCLNNRLTQPLCHNGARVSLLSRHGVLFSSHHQLRLYLKSGVESVAPVAF